MKDKLISVQLMNGLTSDRIATLIQTAYQYKSRIYLQKGDRMANAKSMMGLLALNLYPLDQIVVSAEGEDEEEAVNAVSGFLASRRN